MEGLVTGCAISQGGALLGVICRDEHEVFMEKFKVLEERMGECEFGLGKMLSVQREGRLCKYFVFPP